MNIDYKYLRKVDKVTLKIKEVFDNVRRDINSDVYNLGVKVIEHQKNLNMNIICGEVYGLYHIIKPCIIIPIERNGEFLSPISVLFNISKLINSEDSIWHDIYEKIILDVKKAVELINHNVYIARPLLSMTNDIIKSIATQIKNSIIFERVNTLETYGMLELSSTYTTRHKIIRDNIASEKYIYSNIDEVVGFLEHVKFFEKYNSASVDDDMISMIKEHAIKRGENYVRNAEYVKSGKLTLIFKNYSGHLHDGYPVPKHRLHGEIVNAMIEAKPVKETSINRYRFTMTVYCYNMHRSREYDELTENYLKSWLKLMKISNPRNFEKIRYNLEHMILYD